MSQKTFATALSVRALKKLQSKKMTSVWGPSSWKTLHCFCLGTAPRDSKLAFIHAMVAALPCEECRVESQAYLAAHPPQGDLFEWSVEFHNSVNRRLGKCPISLEKADRCTRSPGDTNIMWPVFTVASAVVAYAAGRYLGTNARVEYKPSEE